MIQYLALAAAVSLGQAPAPMPSGAHSTGKPYVALRPLTQPIPGAQPPVVPGVVGKPAPRPFQNPPVQNGPAQLVPHQPAPSQLGPIPTAQPPGQGGPIIPGHPVGVSSPWVGGNCPDNCETSDCQNCGNSDCGCGSSDWCNLGEKWDLSEWFLGQSDCPCGDGIDFGGWAQLGYHSRSTGVFNNQPNRVNLHQLWLYAEKLANGKEGLDWGFRVDAVYGIDAVDTQAFGARAGTWDFLNGWGNGVREAWAMPQLYGEIAAGDLSVKAGKFFTLIGYEAVPAVNNFFYSHAFTFNFSEPFTHTGVLGSWKANDDITINAGYVFGNDTGFTRNMGGSAFLGSINWAPFKDASFSYALNIGDLGLNGNGFHNTVLMTMQPTENFEWIIQGDFTRFDLNGFDSTAVVNYFFYKLNDCVKLGSRGEWYKVQGSSIYDITAGVNYKPHANLVIRPEYRYQWSPAITGGAANPLGIPVNQHIFGVDLIFSF